MSKVVGLTKELIAERAAAAKKAVEEAKKAAEEAKGDKTPKTNNADSKK